MSWLKRVLSMLSGSGRSGKDEASQAVRKTVIESLGKLPLVEKQIMALFYYEDLTLQEMAAVLNIAEDRVSSLFVKAMMYLKIRLGI